VLLLWINCISEILC